MAYESFYGGRPGAPFIIVKRYSTEAAMIEEFSRGAASTSEVNYGEYVVINAPGYDYNGKVYRRGMDYTNLMGGAEFIGQFIGPKGEPGGIHIIGKVAHYSDLDGKTPEDFGDGGDEFKGWVMAVGEDGDLPDIYAYDYINETWFYCGSLPYTLVTTQRTHAY